MADDAARAMFGTWKYDPETAEVQNLRRSFDPVTARSSQHQACNRCHEKKLKCSGDKDGCERCVAGQLDCEYTRGSSRSSRRSKKSGQRSSESGGRDHHSPGGHSRKSHGRSHKGESSRSGGGSSSHHPSAGATPYALNDLEELLRPEDAFDMGLIASPAATGAAYSSSHAAAAYPAGVAVSSYHGWSPQYGIPGTSAAELNASYAMADAHGYAEEEYGEYEDYADYQNMDPRYWSRGR